ncbi:pilus assembly protein [Methylobacterium sp. J-059]|uniref:TadE/TadG family type IV pilus assembly protein n=1 Tax=Methylobacterium sp. J-059 TaxID=2836643 RepID=UPI001FB9C9AA|nr:TadE/TadG family type IV pilus assembly protein [Methylobacterium sp. J-059]MCJ2039286.1 pilus assembly protein [Methylobacterium sp. J-059]
MPATSTTSQRALNRCEEGAAILEFALVLPLLLALLAGGFELGRALLVQSAITEAVRGGTRYLARVPDPTCRSVCSAGAAHAVALATDQIVDNTRLALSQVRVYPLPDPPSGTVMMMAEVVLSVDMLSWVGLSPTMRLTAIHQEARVAE